MTIAKLMGAVALAALSTPAWAEQVQINLWTVDRPGEYHYKMAEEFSAKNPISRSMSARCSSRTWSTSWPRPWRPARPPTSPTLTIRTSRSLPRASCCST